MRFETILDSLKIRFSRRWRPAGQMNTACNQQESTPGKVAEPMQRKLQAARQNNPTRPFENLGLIDSGPIISPFRLLDLPYDIRVLIYSYLTPDHKRRLGVRFIDEAPPFRGYLYFRAYLPRLRYPPIALTNRQLYKEVLPLWYGSNYYPASIAPSWGFNFMGEINKLISLRYLQHIRNLELRMTLLLPGSLSLSHQRSRQRTKGLELHDLFLKECFRSGTHLSRLKLRVDLSRIEFDSYVGRSGRLRRDLAREMAPLRGVRGLEDVEIVVEGLSLERRYMPGELLGVIHEFMEGLKAGMTSPFTNKEAKE